MWKNSIALSISIIISLEILGFALSVTFGHLFFDHSALVFANPHFTAEKFDSFYTGKSGKDRFDPQLGWTNHEEGQLSQDNCAGEEWVHSYANGRRVTPMQGNSARYALFGDSYAFGSEVSDPDTIAAHLSRKGFPTENFGVGGYGPAQAVQRYIKLKQENGPQYDGAILYVMVENINRMVNSYRPAYSEESGIIFGLKPYMKDGQFHPLENPPENFQNAMSAYKQAFRDDFWAKPESSFPYSISLVRALFTNSFKIRSIGKFNTAQDKGPYYYQFNSGVQKNELISLIEIFSATATANNELPYVVIIPGNYNDRNSAGSFAETTNKQLGKEIVFTMDETRIDWSKYNTTTSTGTPCHPTSKGYEMIADFTIEALKGVNIRNI